VGSKTLESWLPAVPVRPPITKELLPLKVNPPPPVVSMRLFWRANEFASWIVPEVARVKPEKRFGWLRTSVPPPE